MMPMNTIRLPALAAVDKVGSNVRPILLEVAADVRPAEGFAGGTRRYAYPLSHRDMFGSQLLTALIEPQRGARGVNLTG